MIASSSTQSLEIPTLMELSHVSRVYGTGEAAVWALRDVSLIIRAGDFVSIVGPSGSGKSTMLGLLGCLDVPTEGTITVGDEEVTRLADAARTRVRGKSIGFVFQQFHLIPHLDALGNVETALLYRSLKPPSGESERWHLSNKWVLDGAPITDQYSCQAANNSVLPSLGLS